MSNKLLVWVQTSKHRDPTETLDSIEASDIQKNYERVHDDHDWSHNSALQAWWASQWLRMSELAQARGADHILRLEDDILVNRYIAFNVLAWPALDEPSFGYGSLFCPDYWSKNDFNRVGICHIRNAQKVECGQGQVLPTTFVPELLSKMPEALEGEPLSWDWAVSQAACLLGRMPYVHIPSLVNVRDISRRSSLSRHLPEDQIATHIWGAKNYAPKWRRPKSQQRPVSSKHGSVTGPLSI